MAQRVQVLLVDDMDGGDADETVSFGLDGASYEIDLSSGNAGQLRDILTPYVEAGRKVGGRRRRKSAKTAAASEAPTKEIRKWALENGWEVPDRGRIAAEVREAYAAAHGG